MTLSSPEFKKHEGRFSLVKLDTSDEKQKKDAQSLNVKGLPWILLFTASGTELQRWQGVTPATELIAGVNAALKKASTVAIVPKEKMKEGGEKKEATDTPKKEKTIQWIYSLADAKKEAQEKQKPLFVKFGAPW